MSVCDHYRIRGTQGLFSVKYLFGEANIQLRIFNSVRTTRHF